MRDPHTQCVFPRAAADTPVVADPSARNVTAYGTTVAWSRWADDGWRLVVSVGGAAADAPVPASPVAYDPDLGPTKANGRAIVYARGGDLYRYDVGAASERRLTRIFRTVAAETDVAETRIAGRYGEGTKSIIRVLNYTNEAGVRRIVPELGF